MLHFWMELFGSSDIAVRSLSGLIGVATLPVAWLAGKRVGGRSTAWAALVITAVSPFDIYYSTEVRMYSLVVLLSGLLLLAVCRALENPSPLRLFWVALFTAALLYTHYWSLYLMAVVVLLLAFLAYFRPEAREYRYVLAAVVVGALSFLPWFPIFVFQARHTGTPWAYPGTLSSVVHALSEFAGGAIPISSSPLHRVDAFLLFDLAILAVLGFSIGYGQARLDRTKRRSAFILGAVVTATLGLALIGSRISDSAYASRYAAVVYLFYVLLAGLGVSLIANSTTRMVMLTSIAVLGIIGSVPNVYTNRTEAGRTAAIIKAHISKGDVVGYCPDQLGPAVARLLPSHELLQLTFPRGTSPQFVDWVNYAQHIKKAHASSFAHRMEELASGGHTIWFVWAPGYRHFDNKCHQISKYIGQDRAYTAKEVLKFQPQRYFEPDIVMEYVPRQSVAAPSLTVAGARWPAAGRDSSTSERSLTVAEKDFRK